MIANVALVFFFFFLSGISGLIYQVLWVRVLGNAFGNTVYSAAMVTSVFMAGLGLGSYIAGRLADRVFQKNHVGLLRWYGISELLIGLFGLMLAYLLPKLATISAGFSSYVLGSEGFYELSVGSHLLSYGWGALLLLPPTLLMGGTLTLLIRFLVARELSQVGWRVAWLYGLNTLGAALGAFSCDFYIVPQIGLLGTQQIAAALNALAGLGGITLAVFNSRQARGVLGASDPAGSPSSLAPAAEPQAQEVKANPEGVRPIVLALFLAGFAAMGLEIVWFRFLSSILGEYRAVFSLLLTVILIGIWAGSLLGGWLQRRFHRPGLWFMLAQTILIASTTMVFVFYKDSFVVDFYREVEPLYAQTGPVGQAWLQTWSNLRLILFFVGVPSLCMGLGFPLANALCQQVEQSVGRRAGSLYLANTAGNVAGSILSGFVLLPVLGAQTSVSVCCLFSFLAVVSIFLYQRKAAPIASPPSRSLRNAFTGCVLVAMVAFALFALLPVDYLLTISFPDNPDNHESFKVLTRNEGINENLMISERPDGIRFLFCNGHPMSSSGMANQRYMRAFVHYPLMQMKDPKSVLIICFGVGNTLHAASLYPTLERLEVVDLSKDILRHAGYFSLSNHGVLKDDRVKVFVNDGRHHLLLQPPESYDLITLEPPPVFFAGVAALYSKEFYELAKSRLRRGGFISQWFPAYQPSEDASLSMLRAFVDVFPNAVMLNGYGNTMILLGRKDAKNELDLEQMEENRTRYPVISKELHNLLLENLTEWVGGFAASAETLRAATQDAKAVSDDYPISEYSVQSNLTQTQMPRSIFDTSAVSSWCSKCLHDPTWSQQMPDLEVYLRLMQRVYGSPQFLQSGYGPRPFPKAVMISFDAAEQAAIQKFFYLRQVMLAFLSTDAR